jgi:hypothetical protein
MAQLARILAEIWLSMLSLFIIIFALIVIVTEGFQALWSMFSNLSNWEELLALALPGISFLVLAKALRR